MGAPERIVKPHVRGPHADIAPLRTSAEAFQGASWSHPDLRNWAPSQGSADSDILPELGTLTRRARDLERNHGVASGAKQTLVDNILGCGLWLAPTPDYVALGKTREWASQWRKPVKAKWRAYADTVLCDAGESLTLDGLATQMFNGAWANGDGLALPLWMPHPGYPAATRIQVIEADRLSNPHGMPNSARLRGGVEINEYGAPLAYWIRNAHPGDQFWYPSTDAMKWTRIPAKVAGIGRRRVIHAHDKGRAGQTRGVPAVASVLQQFKVLGDYQRAELKASVVNAMVGLITESAIGQEGLVELLSSNPEALSKYTEGLSARGRSSVNFSEGLILPLILGEKVSGFTPARPSTAYEPFVTTVFRHIATGLNIPYELLMKDFSKTNYSSARASLLEAWRFFIGRRNWLAQSFYQAVYELWLEEKVNLGEIEAPDYYENRAAYCRARWIGPGRGWVDPYKEAQAAELRMDIMVSTLEDECAEQGKDWEEVLEQLAEEKKRMGELHLERKSTRTPAPAAAGGGGEEPPPRGASDDDVVATAQAALLEAQSASSAARAAVQAATELQSRVHRALSGFERA